MSQLRFASRDGRYCCQWSSSLNPSRALPLCKACIARLIAGEQPEVVPSTTMRAAATPTTPEQRRALTVPAPPKASAPEPVRRTHEEWCRHYGVRDWLKEVDAPPSLHDAVRTARQSVQTRTADTHSGSSYQRDADMQVPAPPSLNDAVRAARRGGRS